MNSASVRRYTAPSQTRSNSCPWRSRSVSSRPAYQEGEPWPSLFYANLVHNFMQEIVAGGDENQGNFAQSARVQEVINAVELSVREARWVDLPLP